MKAQLLKWLIRLRSSFWFLPSVMAAAAGLLAVATVWLDDRVASRWIEAQPWAQGWLYGGGPDGASDVLSVIAGSMMTIAGVVFSMTLVALSLASSQLGPRLLRNFMRDRVNQWVLGTFIATFFYCLLVLRTIRHTEGDEFVPQLSVSIGVVFALASLWVFIYFIHHVSVMIQSSEVVGRVGRELNACIDRFGNAPRSPQPEAPAALPAGFQANSKRVGARGDGYLQIIDGDSLLRLACAHDLVLEVHPTPGDYLTRGDPLLHAWPGERVDAALAGRISRCFVVGNQRTSEQDLGFPLAQLVEMALRAMSPGINDPITAISCVDRIGSALTRLIQLDCPSRCLRDTHRRLRVWRADLSFPVVLDSALDPLREVARPNTALTLRLMAVLTLIARHSTRDEDRAALQRQAAIVCREARTALPAPEDAAAVEARLVDFGNALTEAGQRARSLD